MGYKTFSLILLSMRNAACASEDWLCNLRYGLMQLPSIDLCKSIEFTIIMARDSPGESYEENLQTYHHIHHPPSQFHLASLINKKHQSVVYKLLVSGTVMDSCIWSR